MTAAAGTVPAVTIGVPVYNGERYLDDALAALAAQTFADFVVLVSDNCSTDGTPAILAKWAARDPRFVVHRQPANIGAVPNFTWLLDQARSEYFMFAAYDDGWSPNYVAELHRLFEHAPRAGLAVAQSVKMHPDGREDLRTPAPRHAEPAGVAARWRRICCAPKAVWHYGLFRTSALRPAFARSVDFGQAWAADHLVVLPFLLADAVIGSNAATFHQRQTTVSEARYKPRTLAAQWRLLSRFTAFSLAILKEAPVPLGTKLALLPFVLAFVNAKAWKFRRLLRSALLYPFRRIKA